jgi:RimJ/RimL family protein N-acetyltransferase
MRDPEAVLADENVTFRREIYREDVEKLLEWMRDDVVTSYLNEDQNIDESLTRLLRQSTLPLFSASFNRDGAFYMVELEGGEPIGFLRLVSRENEAEIVVVIGEREHWGEGHGYRAVRKGIRHALFEWRKKRLIAKIHRRNERSKRLFRKAGFTKDKDLPHEIKYSIDVDRLVGAKAN